MLRLTVIWTFFPPLIFLLLLLSKVWEISYAWENTYIWELRHKLRVYQPFQVAEIIIAGLLSHSGIEIWSFFGKSPVKHLNNFFFLIIECINLNYIFYISFLSCRIIVHVLFFLFVLFLYKCWWVEKLSFDRCLKAFCFPNPMEQLDNLSLYRLSICFEMQLLH